MSESTTFQEVSPGSTITVVGAGLAGTECALQLAGLGHQVDLIEMRGVRSTPAHKTDQLAELVCSNSFGSTSEQSAPGLLKEEAGKLGSEILRAGQKAAVPAGQALGVDRQVFSQELEHRVAQEPRIRLIRRAVTSLTELPRPCVIASGPLTGDELAQSLRSHFGGDFLYFFDAIAPVLDADSIDRGIVFAADRYGKSTPDYLNCPLDRNQYVQLISEIENAQKVQPKHFEETPFFEGCMPIEEMVRRGPDTLRFGPLKPVGLEDPRTGRRPWAVVQLRQENAFGTSYNMVGFQTRMTYSEQVRVFRQIPGLAEAEFLKLGSLHRNLYLKSPVVLNQDLSSRRDPWLFFAGQITGVEGYFESACIGLLVAHQLHRKLTGQSQLQLPSDCALGALWNSLTEPSRIEHFQPTNINWGLFPEIAPPLGQKKWDKKLKREALVARARQALQQAMGGTLRDENANGISPRRFHESPPPLAPHHEPPSV